MAKKRPSAPDAPLTRETLKAFLLDEGEAKRAVSDAWMTLRSCAGNFESACSECGNVVKVTCLAPPAQSQVTAATNVLHQLVGKPEQRVVKTVEKKEYHRAALSVFIRLCGSDEAEHFANELADELDKV